MAMIPSLLPSFLLPLVILMILKSEANDQLIFRYHECNNILGNFTPGSTYNKNRDTLLEKIYSNTEIEYGFYNFSIGHQDPVNRVNAIGLCRADVKPDDCRSCLKTSASLLTDRCPLQKEAIGYYDLCILRYSNDSIFGVVETDTSKVYVLKNRTDPDLFDQIQTLQGLLDRLKSAAADGDSRRKFAEGSAPVLQSSNDTSIYALLQCTPDLSKQNCTQCLDSALKDVTYWCDYASTGTTGCLYLGPSCSVRFETHAFLEPMATAPAPAPHPPKLVSSPLPPQVPGKSKTLRTVIAIVVPVVVVGLLLVLVCIYLGARTRKARHRYIEGIHRGESQIINTARKIRETENEADNDIKATELSQFDFATIRITTNNFSDANKVGQGGFGTVYKGTLFDGREVAIKRLSTNSDQGEIEFKNEVLLTGKLQHRNLVKLLGFCLERRERILIYEFVPNKSLDYIIFDMIKRAKLDWERRYKIIKGIARGLLYLHEDSRLQIVHRDLKTSNILLDEELNPKISDFGIARLFDANQTQGKTQTIVGTFGYMAPEYIKHGHFSVKSDVFSFGVIILEIVCGQRNAAMRNGEKVDDLLSIAWENWRAGTTLNIVDPTLNQSFNDEIMRCIHVGLLCVQEDIADRPTMTSVLLMLNSTSFPLSQPSEPPFLMQGRSLSASSSQQYSEATRSSDSASLSTQGSTNKSSVTGPR